MGGSSLSDALFGAAIKSYCSEIIGDKFAFF
jgi:hypothetical protein